MKRKNKTAGKRLSILLLPFIAGSLCACSEKAQVTALKLDSAYSCRVQITKNDFSCEINLSRSEEGVWQAYFTSPQSLSSMNVTSFGESYAIDYLGLDFAMNTGSLPVGSVVTTVSSSLDHACSSDVKLRRDGEYTIVSGETLCGQYELKFNENSEPCELTLGEGFVASFEDFKRE